MKHQVPESLKFKRLCRRLSIQPVLAVGTLEMLWIATQKNTPRGNIGKFSDEEIATIVGWDGDPEVLIESLVETGWLDRNDEHRLVVHDWHEHAPRYIKGLASKVGGIITSATYEGDVRPPRTRGTYEGDVREGQRNLTKPNLTKPNERNPPLPPKGEPRKRKREKPTHEIPVGEFPAELESAIRDWLEYHKPYKPIGFKHLLASIRSRRDSLGVAAVVQAISRAIANGWQGWDHDSAFGLAPKAKTDPPAVKMPWDLTPEEIQKVRH